MNADDEAILDKIIMREGDYVNHPGDRGGPTRWGVTQETLTVFRGKPVSVDDVKNLSITEARDLLRQKYLVNAGFGQIEDIRLRGFVVDTAVNHGIVGAVRLLQKALKVPVDGIFGPVTLKALKDMSAPKTHLRMIGQRAIYYGQIITKDKSQGVFAAGWMARLNDCIEEFLK